MSCLLSRLSVTRESAIVMMELRGRLAVDYYISLSRLCPLVADEVSKNHGATNLGP